MADSYAAIRNMAFYHHLQLDEIGNTIVDEEDLSVTTHLKVNGISNDFLVKSMYLRLNGVTIRWRSLYHRKVTGTQQGEL